MAGDLITHIDGVPITTPRGGKRFGAVRPGETVRLTLLRNGQTLTRDLTLVRRPEVRTVSGAYGGSRAPAASRELRYTGQLDNVKVQVWSAGGPTVERVGDTMIITVGTSVVRIQVQK